MAGTFTFWCKSQQFGQGYCDGARKKTWGLCRTCYYEKVEGHPAAVKDYDDWWQNNMDAFNREDRQPSKGGPPWARGDDNEETRKRKRVKKEVAPTSDEETDVREVFASMDTVTLLRDIALMVEELRKREDPPESASFS